MKTLLLAAALVLTSSAAFAQMAPAYVPVCPPGTRLMGGSPYGPQCVPYAYGPAYGAPVIVAPPPTDAQVIAGTILGIAGMAIDASMYRRHW